MRHCVYCDEPLGRGIPRAPAPGRRHAYDPRLGRLWEICPRCRRWSAVPLELRWETLDAWEEAVNERGRVLLRSDHLTLVRVDDGEVVRVGRPTQAEWGGWRYGERLPHRPPRDGFFRRMLATLPPLPLEGYDPYGLGGGLGGVGGTAGESRWLGSPFLARARPLTVAFTSIPFADGCPSCGIPMPLHPWDFHSLTFSDARGEEAAGAAVRAPCASCGDRVVLPLRKARPAIRLGLGIVDSDPEARKVGDAAGTGLDRMGGGARFLEGLARIGAPLGELDRTERVALGMALDAEAEAEALEKEWREAEEITAIMDGELTEVPGFRAFRARILEG